MIVVRGAGSVIAQELEALLPAGEQMVAVARHGIIPLDADRYLFCQGVINPKTLVHQGSQMVAETFRVNFESVAKECDRIIATNDRARICAIGSESAYTGSFDAAYAAAKAALHQYIETKRLRTPAQQLVCVAPTIIRISGMTIARPPKELDDIDRVRAPAHPKKRFLTAIEVAKAIYFLLYMDGGYTTGIVLRINGGAHTVHG